jgi:mevalonate kinase
MKSWPAKLLLFGEHTVNTGSNALALPLPAFSGRWQRAAHLKGEDLLHTQQQLPQFAAFLKKKQEDHAFPWMLDADRFAEELQKGLIFSSNIPTGYGAGSSGALVAAVFESWVKQEDQAADQHWQSPRQTAALKRMLASMEGFFHGTSSGTDPLICLLRQPVLLDSQGGAQRVELTDKAAAIGSHLFMLDTGLPRKATPLIAWFMGQMAESAFRRRVEAELLPAVDSAISAFLSGNLQLLSGCFQRISAFQLENMTPLIPAAFRQIWQEGLSNGDFGLKICGAGGGGFLLGIAADLNALRQRYPSYRFVPVSLANENEC